MSAAVETRNQPKDTVQDQGASLETRRQFSGEQKDVTSNTESHKQDSKDSKNQELQNSPDPSDSNSQSSTTQESSEEQQHGTKTEENTSGGGITGWITQTIKDNLLGGEEGNQQKEAPSGITGWITGTVKGTVATLLSPITNAMGSSDKSQTDNQEQQKQDSQQAESTSQEGKSDSETQGKQVDTKEEQKQKKDESENEDNNDNEKQDQGRKQKDQKKDQSESTQAQEASTKSDGSLRSLIGDGKSVQLIFGGRCLAVHGRQVIVEDTAPSQTEENTFNIELFKEEEDLVRIERAGLFLTADRNVGVLMAPMDSGKINSFHLERNGDLFALRVHNDQKWIGVGLKAEKKSVNKEQHGVEIEKDGQLFVEVNKCYQFDMQSDHIWMRLSFL
eukprot:TRINITY_DN3207_c0_g1_i1.p1 TRINITY_DN3207_c0_g1~~TRINITY_DN3207_c0_g1_i1.p1  ORF type:complete len:390 (+),score=112.97 TRINITY_DN3207_c0_g1_i1:90-1259(+)